MAVLLAACCAMRAEESVQARLLRTVQLGAPQGISGAQIKVMVEDPKTDFATFFLARSALLVLHEEVKGEGFDNLLTRVLNTPLASGNEYPQPPGLQSGFGGKELVFTMVYAMVMSGQQEHAVDLLEKHLFTGSYYKQAVVLQALRNIGTQRAKGLIQKYQEKGDYHNLAENTLVDEDLPVLSEIHDRWNMIPPAARSRANLLSIVQGGCGERQAMAAYWLGYFPPSSNAAQEQAELSALTVLYQNSGPHCDFMARLIAIKSLGLRSAESINYWATLLRTEPQIWLRHQILINAFGRFGRPFAPAALDLLASESSQYIQWQLMQGNIECRMGQRFRTYWDMWIPVGLQFLVVFPDPGHQGTMSAADQEQLLRWLESGHRPQDRVVLNHMLYALISQTRGRNTRRLLTVFNNFPDRNKNWWILTPLEDPSAVPLLKYYAGLPSPGDQHQQLAALIESLQRGSNEPEVKKTTCCEPTAACLRSMLGDESARQTEIRSEQSARAWLAGSPRVTTYRISFSGPLKRTAVVHLSGKRAQHWQYLYDCWRRTDLAASRQPKAASE
ncbi:MAG TPA: hypothetical protein VET69_14100 [Terriglobales bacterium]|nr:hypothetical protein [Terriglobales bacterium]